MTREELDGMKIGDYVYSPNTAHPYTHTFMFEGECDGYVLLVGLDRTTYITSVADPSLFVNWNDALHAAAPMRKASAEMELRLLERTVASMRDGN